VLEGKRIVVLRTFSKIHGMAGIRIGYGIARRTSSMTSAAPQ
jgi:histidinol-phosphate aminotransferase